MTNIPIPIQVLYAGLAGTLLALIVATIQQRWSLRVFFLLALRLAIGWHFLFEGLYKVNTHFTGETTTNSRAFTSKDYFAAAPGPLGPYMRKQFGDIPAEIEAKVRPGKPVTPEAFAKLSGDEQAAACPKPVADQIDRLEEKAAETAKKQAETAITAATADEEKQLKAIAEAEEKETKAAKTDEEKAKAKEKAAAARARVKAAADEARKAAAAKAEGFKEGGKALVTAAKATYARWVYGVDGRPAKLKAITGRDSPTGDVVLSAPQRYDLIVWLRNELKAGEERQAPGLGSGTGTDAKRLAEVRTDLLRAEADLLKDADAFALELKKGLTDDKDYKEDAPKSRGELLDTVTMWFLVGVGACLMLGLFTRLACLLGAGFLVTTYLLHPPFPWFPQPPVGVEGNPVFVNKNVIEFLALMVLVCYPTGRWLGIDALISRILLGPAPRPAEPA